MTPVFKGCDLGASAAASARFDRARREAKTSCEGLFDGHKFESTAGRTDAEWRDSRKEGPPNSSG